MRRKTIYGWPGMGAARLTALIAAFSLSGVALAPEPFEQHMTAASTALSQLQTLKGCSEPAVASPCKEMADMKDQFSHIVGDWKPTSGETVDHTVERLKSIYSSFKQVNGDLGALRENFKCPNAAGSSKDKELCQKTGATTTAVVAAAKSVILKDTDFAAGLAGAYAKENPGAVADGIKSAMVVLKSTAKAGFQVDLKPDTVHVEGMEPAQILSAAKASIDNARSMKKDILPTITGLDPVMTALDGLDKALDGKAEQGDSGKTPIVSDKPSNTPLVGSIARAKQIIEKVTSADAETVRGVKPDAKGETVDTSLKDIQAYLTAALAAGPVETGVATPNSDPCVSTVPANSKAALDCLNSADAILAGELQSMSANDERRAWVDRAKRSIEGITKKEETPNYTLMWIAAGSSLLSFVLLAVTLALTLKAPKPKAMSDATRTELDRLGDVVTTTVGHLKRVSNSNQELEGEKEAAEAKVRELTEKLRAQQQARGPEPLPPAQRAASAGQTASGPASGRATETPPPGDADGFGVDVIADYNLARRKGPDLEDRFKSHYAPIVAMECTNLALRNLEGGRLPFKEASRGSFFSLRYKTYTFLFPQFNMEYRSSENIMGGIFNYPAGTSENLKLKRPALLAASAEGWVLELAGEFVDA